MATFRLDVLTPEKLVFASDVDMVLASAVDGQLGILPHHAPLITMLQPGDLVFRKAGKEESLVVSGGFLEVRPNRSSFRPMPVSGRKRSIWPGPRPRKSGPRKPFTLRSEKLMPQQPRQL